MTEEKKIHKATTNGAPPDPSMKVRIHPPAHFLASCMATLVLGGLRVGGSQMQISSPRRNEWTLLGIAGFAGAVGLARSALLTFKKKETPIPHGYKVKTIVSEGVFGFSRNPIYVAMVGGVASLGVAMNTYWGGVSALYLMGAIHHLVIPHEENYLESNFGKDYVDYKAKVPRWLLFV